MSRYTCIAIFSLTLLFILSEFASRSANLTCFGGADIHRNFSPPMGTDTTFLTGERTAASKTVLIGLCALSSWILSDAECKENV